MGLIDSIRGGDDVPSADELAEQQHESQIEAAQHSANYQGLQFGESGKIKEEHFEQLIQSGVPRETAFRLRSLLTRDFMLSNLTDAEVTEAKWLNRILKMQLYAQHPPQGSMIKGEWRAALFNDQSENLIPLDAQARTEIDGFIRAAFAAVARSRDGWQQEELSKQYSVAEHRSEGDDDDGGWL